MTKSALPKVYVCILSWNRRDGILACLRAVFALDYGNYRVVVVDNASTDGSVVALRELGTRIDLIENSLNLGYTGGCNLAMRHALERGADYVWLLNDDVDIDPDTLRRLVSYAQQYPDLGIVSPTIWYARGTNVLSYCGGRIDVENGVIAEAGNMATAMDWQERYPKHVWLWGTAMLIKRAVIERIGLLDDQFFAYWEDSDYAVRSNAAGFLGAHVFDVKVYHSNPIPQAKAAVRKPHYYYYKSRNLALFWFKHARGRMRWRMLYWHSCSVLRMAIRCGNHRDCVNACLDGLWCGLRRKTGEWRADDVRLRMPSLLRRMVAAKLPLWLALVEGRPWAVLGALLPGQAR